jgi:predicted esterase/PKD repeat protein
MKIKIVSVLIISVLTIGLFGASTKSQDQSCRDVLILFARGSGQNPNGYLANSLSDPDFYKEEPQSYTFFKEISSRITDVSVEKISLRDFKGRYNQYGYKAVNVEEGFTRGPTHRSDVFNRYYESVADGAEELTWFLEDRLTSCPFQQVILGGYSQGAHVVGDALYKLKPYFRPRINYVALYGDPKFNPRTSTLPLMAGRWARGNAWSIQSGILGPRGNYLPDEIANVTSWCDFGDPICANHYGQNPVTSTLKGLFVDRTHQNIYQEKWIPLSANEIVNSIRKNNQLFAENMQTITWLNKNDKLYKLDLALVLDGSGSMTNILKNLKKRLEGFTNSLFNSYWDTRVGVVAFNDSFPWEPLYFSRLLTDFTYDRETVKSAIYNLQPQENPDTPEAQYSGLMTAMNNLSWREGAQKKILVMTDAPPKNPDPQGWTSEQVVRRALELDPVSISYAQYPLNNSWASLADIYSQQISSATNGMVAKGTFSYEPELILDLLDQMDLQPVASINGPAEGVAGNLINFSGGDSYDPDGSIKEYAWDFNDDGVWDYTSDNPLAEYTYIQPYTGLVVLEVRSEDGGSAKAIHNISVSPQSNITTGVPETPQAVAIRSQQDVNITWSNNYDNGTAVYISDLDDNVTEIVANASNYLLQNAITDAFSLKLTACNSVGCSEPVVVNVPGLVLSSFGLGSLQNTGITLANSYQISSLSDVQLASTSTASQTPNQQSDLTDVESATTEEHKALEETFEHTNSITNKNSLIKRVVGLGICLVIISGLVAYNFRYKKSKR